MTTRRRFFSIMGAAPLAAKGAAEQAARSLAGVTQGNVFPQADLRGMLVGHDGPTAGNATAQAMTGDWRIAKEFRDGLLRKALDSVTSRAELEGILYEDNRQIHALDHDLAANRSMSLAAKITFQRQRVVQRAIQNAVMEQAPYRRIEAWKERILNVAGIKF